jgi:hypothetical protein
MSKKMTKKNMVSQLTALQAHLAQHTANFPGLIPVVVALGEAIANPSVAPESAKVETKAAGPKPVTIDYSGESLLVKTPWGQAGKALAHAFKVIVGKRSKTINPETGEPYFLSTYDKKVKAFRLPKEKEAEVRAAIEESGLPCEG